MIALAPLLRSRATVGVALSAGVLLAVWANGAVKYRQGVHDGTTRERAAWSSEVALARNSATASQVAADAATSALRDTVGRLRDRVAVLSEDAALARGNYRAALAAYQREKLARGDSALSPEQAACDELARACAVQARADSVAHATTKLTLAKAEQLVAKQDSFIRKEPARTSLAVREALAVQRATFPKPNRVGWAALGGVIGASLAWVVVR